MFSVVPEQPCHKAAITSLLDQAFGPGRFARTANLMRQGTEPIPDLSLIAIDKDRLIGSIQFSPIQVGRYALLLLGPLVVDPEQQGSGVGLALLKQGAMAAQSKSVSATILVGDAPYYERAGFAPLPYGRIGLPGPLDPARLLGLGHNGFDVGKLSGSVIPGWPIDQSKELS